MHQSLAISRRREVDNGDVIAVRKKEKKRETKEFLPVKEEKDNKAQFTRGGGQALIHETNPFPFFFPEILGKIFLFCLHILKHIFWLQFLNV